MGQTDRKIYLFGFDILENNFFALFKKNKIHVLVLGHIKHFSSYKM